MPWLPPVVAHVDKRGNLLCVECGPELADEPRDTGGYPVAVHGDEHFSADDKCERCCKKLQHVPTSRYIFR